MRWLTPARLAAGGLFLLGAAAFVLWLMPAGGTDILLVDPAHPVDQIVEVPGDARTPQSPDFFFGRGVSVSSLSPGSASMNRGSPLSQVSSANAGPVTGAEGIAARHRENCLMNRFRL